MQSGPINASLLRQKVQVPQTRPAFNSHTRNLIREFASPGTAGVAPVDRQIRVDSSSQFFRPLRQMGHSDSSTEPSRKREADDRLGIPRTLKAGLEALSGLELSNVRVHRESPEPSQLNAFAFARGRDIYLGPGQESHLPHEAWHVVQQMQGRVRKEDFRLGDIAINSDSFLESEADRMGQRALGSALAVGRHRRLPRYAPGDVQSSGPVQRQVRTNGGAQRVNESHYVTGGGKSVGSKRSVASLIGDGVRRVFTNKSELEDYANGKTDYIGDVATTAAGTFWYRLPKLKLTVLGESHSNVNGNVEDVILGLQTSRFMYEGLNELQMTKALNISFASTESRLGQITAGERVGKLVDKKKFKPELENIVIKALTGASITRNEFIAGNPAGMGPGDIKTWGKRTSTSDWSYGERVALYLSMGIHLAKDVSKENFGPPNSVELPFIASARDLKNFYVSNQAVLDAFMKAKDTDDLIGIYELTAPNSFGNLSVIKDFTLVLHEYASRYIEQLGSESGNKQLKKEGTALSGNLAAKIDDLSPAREEIMWEKIQLAKKQGYLVVGMGDAHRTHLKPRLDAAGISHEEVAQSLTRQKTAVDAAWKA